MRTLRPLLNSSHKSFEPFKYELIPGNPVLVESWLEDHIPYNPAYKPPLVIGPSVWLQKIPSGYKTPTPSLVALN